MTVLVALLGLIFLIARVKARSVCRWRADSINSVSEEGFVDF